MLQRKDVDGVINIPSNIPNIFYSDTIINYENVAIALKENNFKVNNVHDLKGRKVLAFQSAAEFLTPEFATMAKENPRYHEATIQLTQPYHLYLGRTEVIVLDKRIFMYLRKKVKLRVKTIDISKPVLFYDIFPRSPRKMGFHDQQLMSEFNTGLKKLRASGKYQQMVNKYPGKLSD